MINAKKPYKKEKIDELVKEALDGKTHAEFAAEFMKNLKADSEAYLAEKEKELKPERFEELKNNTDRSLSFREEMVTEYKIGQLYEISGIQGVEYNRGVLIDMRRTAGSGNPTAPSKFRMVFALNNALQRYVINGANFGGAVRAWELDQSKMERWDEQLTAPVRHTRHMITGNLLQGFSDNGGVVVRFTMKDGAVRDGILLPLSYQPGEQAGMVRVNPEQAAALNAEAVMLLGDTVNIQPSDADHSGSDNLIMMPRSKQLAGRFFLDDALRHLTVSGEFETRGDRMRAVISREKIKRAIERIYTLGDTFKVPRSDFEKLYPPTPKVEDTAEQYSITNLPSGKPITMDDVRRVFKGQQAGVSVHNKNWIWVRTRGGHGILIKTVNRIAADKVQVEAEYGQMDSDGQLVAGKYKSGVIELARDIADRWTLVHEAEHFAEDAGLISAPEIRALKLHIQKLAQKGLFTPQDAKNVGGKEDRARFIAAEMARREQHQGIIRRILDTIAGWIDRLAELAGIHTAGGTVRAFSQGRLFDRSGLPVRRTQTGIEFAADIYRSERAYYEETAGRWHSQMVNFLTEKLPGKGTGKSYLETIHSWAKKGMIKAEELEWSGLGDWLDMSDSDRSSLIAEHEKNIKNQKQIIVNAEGESNFESISRNAGEIIARNRAEIKTLQSGNITKQAILDFLAANHVKVEEVIKGAGPDGSIDVSQFIVEDDMSWSQPEGIEPVLPSALKEQMLELDREDYLDEDGEIDQDRLEDEARDRAYENWNEFGMNTRVRERESDWEIHYSPDGIFNIFDDHGKFVEQLDSDGVTLGEVKQRVFEILEERGIAISEDRANEITEGIETRHSSDRLRTPGGENYRELLLTLPSTMSAKQQEINNKIGSLNREYEAADDTRQIEISKEIDALNDKFSALPRAKDYTSGHWDEANVLTHVRFNERTGPDGKKVLFIEEIQSDWHQTGRNRGYALENKKALLKNQTRLGEIDKILSSPTGYTKEEGSKLIAERAALAKE